MIRSEKLCIKTLPKTRCFHHLKFGYFSLQDWTILQSPGQDESRSPLVFPDTLMSLSCFFVPVVHPKRVHSFGVWQLQLPLAVANFDALLSIQWRRVEFTDWACFCKTFESFFPSIISPSQLWTTITLVIRVPNSFNIISTSHPVAFIIWVQVILECVRIQKNI